MTGPGATAVNDLRPRTVGEILDASFAVYRRRFGRLLLVATILGAPTLLLALVIAVPHGDSTRDYLGVMAEMFDDALHDREASMQERLDLAERVQTIGWELQGYALLQGLIQSFARGVTAVAMGLAAWEVLHRREVPSIGALVKGGLRRAVPACGVHLAGFVVTSLCAICLPVPIVFGSLLAPACAVLAIEQGPIERSVRGSGLPGPLAAVAAAFLATFDAIGRSCSLGWHAMSIVRSTFLVTVVLLLLAFVNLLVGATLGLVFESYAVFFVTQQWVEVLLLPQIGLAFAFWYAELRVRREALDLAPADTAGAAVPA